MIEDNIEDPMSEEILRGKFTYGTKIKMDVKDDKLAFSGKKSLKLEHTARDRSVSSAPSIPSMPRPAPQKGKNTELQKKA